MLQAAWQPCIEKQEVERYAFYCSSTVPLVTPTWLVLKSPAGADVQRAFCMRDYHQRYIALEVFYLGWAYHGFASQTGIEATVEVPPLGSHAVCTKLHPNAPDNLHQVCIQVLCASR